MEGKDEAVFVLSPEIPLILVDSFVAIFEEGVEDAIVKD